MTLIIQKPTGAKLVMAKNYPADDDSRAYIAAVEAADGQSLESGVKMAIDAFVLGCKADGIWNAIKASCILAGARTRLGALTPLVGAAPTPFNFIDANYDRKTGLIGDGTSKYLNSNRSNSTDPQNNNHNACWVSTPAIGVLMASSSSLAGQNYMDIVSIPQTRFSNRNNAAVSAVSGAAAAGFYGHSRSNSTQASFRCPQNSGLGNYSSQTTDTRNVFLYTRTDDGISFSAWSSARLAFYSIGESLDLSLLDARVTDLINAFAAAIP
jgi:hypothetical protein